MLKIGILPGDDIGPAVVSQCVEVMKAAAANGGLDVEWRELSIGRRGHELHGDTFSAVTEKALKKLNGWILGPIGHSAYPRNDPTWMVPPCANVLNCLPASSRSRHTRISHRSTTTWTS